VGSNPTPSAITGGDKKFHGTVMGQLKTKHHQLHFSLDVGAVFAYAIGI